MNFTVFRLFTTNLKAPCYAVPSKRLKTDLRLCDIHITKSFSSFINIISDNVKLKLSRSTFKYSIEAPIKFTSMKSMFQDKITTHTMVFQQNMKQEIIDTSFIRCSSENGGAIEMSCPLGDILISHCSFENCYAYRSGGAIHGEVGDITTKYSCFSNCFSNIEGNSVTIFGYLRNKTLEISDSFFTKCPNKDLLKGDACIHAKRMNLNTALLNITDCHNNKVASTFAAYNQKNVQITYSNFANCTSKRLMCISKIGSGFVSMINNFLWTRSDIMLEIHCSGFLLHNMFIGNSFKKIVQGKLGTINFENCFIDSNSVHDACSFTNMKGMHVTLSPTTYQMKLGIDNQCKILDERNSYRRLQIMGNFNSKIENIQQLQEFEYQIKFVTPSQSPTPTFSNSQGSEKPMALSLGKEETNGAENGVEQAFLKNFRSLQMNEKKENDRRERRERRERYIRDNDHENGLMEREIVRHTIKIEKELRMTEEFVPSERFTIQPTPQKFVAVSALYASAAFVIFAVLASFLFLRSGDGYYAISQLSGSADSRTSDYASSASINNAEMSI